MKEEVQVELMGCSNPKADADICKKCIRNQPSEEYESFLIKKPLMSTVYECNGYINKNNPPLFK